MNPFRLLKRLFNSALGLLIWPIVAVVGAGTLAFGLSLRGGVLAEIAQAGRAVGTVVQLDETTARGRNETRTLYYPVIEFSTEDGRAIRARSAVGSNPPARRVNEQVTVLYNKSAPAQFRLDTFEDLWLLPTAVIVSGAFFVLVGVAGLLQVAFTLVGVGGLIGAVLWLSRRRSAGRG